MKGLYAIATALVALIADVGGCKSSEIGAITCFADSAKGMRMAEIAAEFLNAQGHGKLFSKSYAVSEMDDEHSNRMLILILSDEGEQEFKKSRGSFDRNMLALLQRMQTFFEDNKVSVVLQGVDKSNLAEAALDAQGVAFMKNYAQGTPGPD